MKTITNKTICTFLAATSSLFLFATNASSAEFVINGDFEADAELFVTWPGYVGGDNPPDVPDWLGNGGRGINPVQPDPGDNPANIPRWQGGGGHGINPVVPDGPDDAPFRDNGDNDTTVAFLQGNSNIRQDISGLAAGTGYVLSLDFNSRNCCGDVPIAALSLNGEVVPDFPGPDFVDGIVDPVGDIFPWYHADIPFTADDSNLSLVISAEPSFGGDASFLVDNVSLKSNAGGAELVSNGDFETATDTFTNWPGYVSGPGRLAPFRDNGDNKSSVAFMQGAATIEQDVSGLTVGQEYVLSFDYNARNCCGDFPIAELTLDGFLVDEFPDPDLDDGIVIPVGGNNPLYRFEYQFVADAETIALAISTISANGGDASFVVDNVSITEFITGPIPLAGDADLDRDFDQLDLVKVQIASKYLTGQASTWGEGDWDGSPDPNSSFNDPPAGDALFNQRDIISALAANTYLTGPYAALAGSGTAGDEQTSLVYDAGTGELKVDSPASKDLTSINITSAGGRFIGDKPSVLDGAFDNFAADNIFKATFGGSFGDISFGNVLPAALSEADVTADLTAVGSLAGGGDLGAVDLIYIPEPSTIFLLASSLLVAAIIRRPVRVTG